MKPIKIALISLLLPLWATGQIIHTIAGTGSQGYDAFSGNGGPATLAELGDPRTLTVDDSENVYYVDHFLNCIRKINPNGIITTIAGTGVIGYAGDGGPATNARFYNPTGILWVAPGILYIADMNSQRVRKIDATGIITTVAGNGGYDQGFTGDGGPATAAFITEPYGVAMDKLGNLYITESGAFRVRKVDPSGIITTSAGTGLQGYSGDGGPANQAKILPVGICTDTANNVYFTDNFCNCVRKVNTAGIISTFAGTGVSGYSGDGGPANQATFSSPSHISSDPNGNFYISDQEDSRVRMIDAQGIINTITGNGLGGYSGDGGPAINAVCDEPSSAVMSGYGNLFFTDEFNYVIRKISCQSSPFLYPLIGADTVCINDTSSYKSSLAVGNWTSTGIHSTITSAGVVNGISEGSDSITFTVSDSCGTSSISKTIYVHDCNLSAPSITETQDEIKLYPNPATDKITIKTQTPIASITIKSIDGRSLFYKEYENTTVASISINNLSSGVYVIYINGNWVSKLVKQ
jgi:hypothetical protein